jgi:hypothetical protein
MVRRWLAAGILLAGPAAAAVNAQPTAGQMVEVDPIRCWWRTSSAAVRVGETFTLGLTCAVLEADGVQVIPDESQLSDSAIQLNPFEVVGGSHPPDLRSGQRRFFQYEYATRIINPDVIGQDVPLPNLIVHYRVNSRLPGNAAMQGRDLSYLLPAHTVRVLSLVPTDANDIRDASGASFGRVEALGARAGVFEIAAITFAALGGLMTVVSLVTLARGARKRKTTGEKVLAPWRVVRTAHGELAAVERDAAGGWNDALIGRALAATRVVAAALVGRVVSQARTAPDAEMAEGRILAAAPEILRTLRLARGSAMALSSAITARDVSQVIERLPDNTPPSRRQQLETIADSLGTFTAALYGPAKDRDRSALDASLATATSLGRRLWVELIWSRPARRRAAGPAAVGVERQA